MYMGYKLVTIAVMVILASNFLSGCRENKVRPQENSEKIECRLYWIADNYYEDSLVQAKERYPFSRQVSLNYLLINHTNDVVFVPFTTWNDTAICSQIQGYLCNNPIDISIHKRTDFSFEIGSNDTTHVEIRIYGKALKKIGIDEQISLKWIVANFTPHYITCNEDRIKSKFDQCPTISFTKNDTIAYHYRTSDMDENIQCIAESGRLTSTTHGGALTTTRGYNRVVIRQNGTKISGDGSC